MKQHIIGNIIGAIIAVIILKLTGWSNPFIRILIIFIFIGLGGYINILIYNRPQNAYGDDDEEDEDSTPFFY